MSIESGEEIRVSPIQNESRHSPPECLPVPNTNEDLSAPEKSDPWGSCGYSAGRSSPGGETSGFEEAGKTTNGTRGGDSPARDVEPFVQEKGTSPESRCRPYSVEIYGRAIHEAVADEEEAEVLSRD